MMTQIFILDFETHFSTEYSLTRLTTEEYVRNEQFQALCLGVMPWNKLGMSFVVEGPARIKEWINKQDWANIVVVCHNAQFDCFILSHVYNVKPRYIICTLAMARAVHGTLAPASLEAIAERYGLETKTVPYNAFRGKYWGALDGNLIRQLSAGCLHDVELTHTIAHKLLKIFPKQELLIVDLTTRMYTEPVIQGDSALWYSIAEEEAARKNEALIELGVTEAQLQSTAKLKVLLEECGEEVPNKPGKNGPIPCVAATDEYLQELSERDDRAGALARARIDVRSTITESRAGRLASMAFRGPLPVSLKYFGANTSRWSGGERINLQNLPRKGQLRSGLIAPPGHKFVIVDFSQIEYRILCALAGQTDKLEALIEGRNLYCEFGSTLFGCEITREDKDEYLFSKKIVLGCGYGTGKDKAEKTAKAEGFNFSRETTDRAIDLYRREHTNVVKFWKRCDNILRDIGNGREPDIIDTRGIPVKFMGDAIVLPNGLWYIPELTWSDSERSWFRKTSRGMQLPGQPVKTIDNLLMAGYTRYWGGGLTEWLCQALARVCLSDLILRVYNNGLGVRPCLLVHDEWVGIVPEKIAEKYLERIISIASETPIWWPDGPPFKAEGRVTERYGG